MPKPVRQRLMPLVSVLATFAMLAVVAFALGPRRNAAFGQARPGSGTSTGETAVPRGSQGCTPLETRQPNATGQQPAFPGQTRACSVTSTINLDLIVFARHLEHPWAVEPLGNGELLVTERPGRMRIVSPGGQLGEPIAGLPKVDARGQGGLLDVALSPTFASDRTIYWSYAEPREGGNGTSVARGVLSADRSRLDQVKVIFREEPTVESTAHFGSRLTFAADGSLLVTLGERYLDATRPQAQQLDSDLGKIVRIRPDGSIPSDNPFVGKEGARPEIWTLGHRNVQAAAFDAQGQFWIVEHGTRGGDELNLIRKGLNYGWPLQAYGEEYSGQPIAGAVTSRAGNEQPVYYWDPVIAPSGAQFYTGAMFPEWRNNLFVGGLASTTLVRLVLLGNRVVGEEHLFADRGKRIRDVKQAPDGSLLVVTDEEDGELWVIRRK